MAILPSGSVLVCRIVFVGVVGERLVDEGDLMHPSGREEATTAACGNYGAQRATCPRLARRCDMRSRIALA
jgi:hypothetical protein